MKKDARKLVLMAVLFAMGMGTAVVGQESLKDLAEQEGLSWIAGSWKAYTDEGQAILLSYKWAANGHAIVSSLKIGDTVSQQGLIYFDAAMEEVKQFAVDSRGRKIKSTWESDYGKAVCKTTMADEYGETSEVAIVYSKVNAKTIHVAVHGLEYGVVSDDPYWESDFSKAAK